MIRSISQLVFALLRCAHPNTQKATANSHRVMLILIPALFLPNYAFASDYSWGIHGSGSPSKSAACEVWRLSIGTNSGYFYSVIDSITDSNATTSNCNASTKRVSDNSLVSNSSALIYRSGNSCPVNTVYNVVTGACDAPPPCLGDSVRNSSGICELTCPGGTVPNDQTMVCESMCPTGKFWDFESESCKWPQDDVCPTGSNWNPDTKDCVCDGDGVLSNSVGFRICMKKADGDCTPESPDFIGMVHGTDGKKKAFCSGRARCPDGTKLGQIGKGEEFESVCVPDQGTDESCPGGTSGNLNGNHVCVPKPNQDPDCPSGQSGMVNGAKKCLPKPGDPGSCKAGETPGFTGSGSSMNPVCIPSSYKPDTCPPGQFAWNTSTVGFACVKLPGQAKDPIRDDPTTPDVDESKAAKEGSATSVTKDKDGNVTGTQEMQIKFPEEGLKIEGLLTDEPQIDYFKDANKFSDSELEKLDDPQKEFLRDMTSGDGAFTERSKLDQASNLLGGVFGAGSGCTGQLVLGQHKGTNFAVSCEKLGKMKQLFSWFVYISTIFAIYGVLMRPQVS